MLPIVEPGLHDGRLPESGDGKAGCGAFTGLARESGGVRRPLTPQRYDDAPLEGALS